jgi:CRISPR/Cas system endoribonuclease Cas6 (RAMP superfamily)
MTMDEKAIDLFIKHDQYFPYKSLLIKSVLELLEKYKGYTFVDYGHENHKYEVTVANYNGNEIHVSGGVISEVLGNLENELN